MRASLSEYNEFSRSESFTSWDNPRQRGDVDNNPPATASTATNTRAPLPSETLASERHLLHSIVKHIVGQCIAHEVGRIAIGDLSQTRDDEHGESRNWGKRGNRKLHGWEFDRFVYSNTKLKNTASS
jgi:transposase